MLTFTKQQDLRPPQGALNGCPLCGNDLSPPPSKSSGDLLCSACHRRLWFLKSGAHATFYDRAAVEGFREKLIGTVVEQTGASAERVRPKVNVADLMGGDALDLVEFIMNLDESFSGNGPQEPPMAPV